MQVQSATDTPKKIQLGERAVMVDGAGYLVIRYKEEGAPLEVVYPEEGTPLAAGPSVLFKGSPNPNAGKLFQNWMHTREAQQFLVEFADGVSTADGLASLREDFGDSIVTPRAPADVENLRRVQGLPALLAATVGLLASKAVAGSHRHALSLSLVYVLGMAVTYALAGVAAGLSGTLLSAALQNAWVLGSFALVFVFLSLSMFGFYELQLPTALQSRLSSTASHQHANRRCKQGAANPFHDLQ